ncbi:MAG: DUF2779 domain-containing protein [Elusimicrobiota bacterium]|nr:DUF2779 domain-containing protein [Elusimicrobiota bacterium]
MIKKRISKSQYTRGLQCVKSLWLYNYRKDLMPEVSPGQQAIFDTGHEVGDLARKYYKGGRLIAQDHNEIAGALAETQRLIADGVEILYEATFQAKDILVRCDIIKKVGKAWHLIEVKSSTAVKEEHLPDIAIQKYVMEAAGLKVSKAFLMTIDNTFVKKGPIDPHKFFKLDDLTEVIEDAEAAITCNLKTFFAALSKNAEPKVEIGGCCSSPYSCDFTGYCWKDIPAYSVYNLPYLKEEIKHQLRKRGILKLKDVPADLALSSKAEDMVWVAKNRKPIIKKEEIKDFLNTLEYPLYHVDFETINPAIPLYDGLRPYQQMPFQVSMHVQAAPGRAVKHFEYLADATKDPRTDIINFLLENIGPKGTPLAYNASFEKMVIKGLADFSAKNRKDLEKLVARFIDLAAPFRARAVFLPEFEGSYSIKAVLPALIPDMSYDGMPVANGEDAQNAYKALLSGTLTPAETEALRKDLIAYCRQDTLAMVKVLGHLNNLA